jgi:hypothetical protein
MKNILAIIAGLIIMSFMTHMFIRCIDEEARIDERKRIARGLTQDANEMAAYVEFLEKVGRMKK